ncbi:alpha/beta hydrolase [Streptomyces sparsogenes]|uniref:alpha/beta fold hydrolase n=1 Tax=Streptomyces sparsogenes TaxID=67365 RepID=UPI003317CDA1
MGGHPQGDDRAVCGFRLANARRSFWDEWASITCPTLTIWGQHGIIPPQEIKDMLHQRPETLAMSIPGAGHDIHLEQPNVLRQALQNFIEEVTGISTTAPT